MRCKSESIVFFFSALVPIQHCHRCSESWFAPVLTLTEFCRFRPRRRGGFQTSLYLINHNALHSKPDVAIDSMIGQRFPKFENSVR